MKQVVKLKTEFEKLKAVSATIQDVFEEIEKKLAALNKIYLNLVKTHINSSFLMGLDSFYFQNQLIIVNFDHLKNIFAIIENRMYGEYSKLYKMVQDYIRLELRDPRVMEKTNIKKAYPIYKDLEPQKKYEVTITYELQQNIVQNITELYQHLALKETELNNDAEQSDMGINIENIVNTQRYANSLVNERINLFIRYLDVFQTHHTKYFTRLLAQSQLTMTSVNEDVRLKSGRSTPAVEFADESDSVTANKNKQRPRILDSSLNENIIINAVEEQPA